MAEKPILLHDHEAYALADQAVVQVRRLINPQPHVQIYNDGANRWYPTGVYGGRDWFADYCVNDTLWVQETYDAHGIGESLIVYRANCGCDGDGAPWRDASTMKREHSRFVVKVHSVRAIKLWTYNDVDLLQMQARHAFDFAYRWDAHNDVKWVDNPFVWAYVLVKVPA